MKDRERAERRAISKAMNTALLMVRLAETRAPLKMRCIAAELSQAEPRCDQAEQGREGYAGKSECKSKGAVKGDNTTDSSTPAQKMLMWCQVDRMGHV